MKPETDKNILIFLLTAIALIVLPHVKHLPASLIAYFYLLLGWRFLGIWQSKRLPGKILLFFLTVAGIALLYHQHQGVFGRDAGTNLFITALGLKLMEIKSERDIYLIIYLAFIVATSQFLYEQSILMAAYILLVCCVLLATLVHINSAESQTLLALKTATIITLQALPVAIALFILFPRMQAPKWLLFNESHQARSGLSDSMEPGSISELGLSDELVFRVKFIGNMPPAGQRYWRGPVLSHTDGKRWTEGFYLPPLTTPTFSGTPYRYTILMEPQSKNWVFALDMPKTFSAPLTMNASYQLITSAVPDKRAEYPIVSYTNYNTGSINDSEYRTATQLPGEPSEKIKRLVNELHGFNQTPAEYIGHLLNYFRTEDFHYTLAPPTMEDKPIEKFLFETRYGFCSHYASAFVYLMRVAHIPARVVTGYQGGELNKVGDFLEIRQADAHAWAEVWLKNQGWVRFDPTAAVAPERIEQNYNFQNQSDFGFSNSYIPAYRWLAEARKNPALSWISKARQLWGNVDYHWQRWVINYDNKNQRDFLSSFGLHDIRTMVYTMMVSIALIGGMIGGFLFYRKPKQNDQTLKLYKRFCRKLAKHGLIRHSGEGAKDFAERAKTRLPKQAEDIERITATFIKLRYGRFADKEDMRQLKNLVASFKAY